MAWIESHEELARHPKTRKAARKLGVSIPTVIGHLHCLWHQALSLAEDGDLSRWSPEDIATAAMWDGDPDGFVEALTDCGMGDGPGFLERDGSCGDPDDGQTGELVLHDWWDYAGRLVARRRRDRERKAAARSSGRPKDVQRTSDGQSQEAPEDSRSRDTEPDPTEPDPTRQDRTKQQQPAAVGEGRRCTPDAAAARDPTPDPDPEVDEELLESVHLLGVEDPKATELVERWPAQCRAHLDNPRVQSAKDPPAYFVRAVENGWTVVDNGTTPRGQPTSLDPDEAERIARERWPEKFGEGRAS